MVGIHSALRMPEGRAAKPVRADPQLESFISSTPRLSPAATRKHASRPGEHAMSLQSPCIGSCIHQSGALWVFFARYATKCYGPAL